nr:ParB N-terminal domain-containing protein [Desulfosporosinus fructosivorans]
MVTPSNELIAGERRLRACMLLNYQQIEVRVMSVKDSEHQLQIEISENENRKDFTFSERVDWAKRLERVERLKAKERQSELNGKSQLTENSTEAEKGESRDIVADKSGFGSGKQFEKAKYIEENATEEMIKDLDDGKLSINGAYTTLKKEKQELEQAKKELEQEKENLEQDYESLSNQKDALQKENETLETQLEQALDKKLAVDNTDYTTINSLREQLSKWSASPKKRT